MIRIDNNLYLGEKAEREKRKIIRDLKKGRFRLGVYVITPAANGIDLFDVVPSWMLEADARRERDIRVLAVARGKREALETAGRMIEDALRKTGGMQIGSFFS